MTPRSEFLAFVTASHRASHSARRLQFLYVLLIFGMLLAVSLPASAQGCAQCLDSTRATPPQVQSAYRHAILLLGGAGSALFVGGTVLLRKLR